jgi:protein FrlC
MNTHHVFFSLDQFLDAQARAGIRTAAELGCGTMVVNSGWGYRDEPREAAWARSRHMLGRLAEAAAREGVVLAMEALRPEESGLVTTLADARRMVAEVGHPALRVTVDTTAMGVAGETLQQWFDAFGAAIVHMHFVDGTPYGHLVWGDGDRPMAEFVQCLLRNGYRGFLGQELTDERYCSDPAAADAQNMGRWGEFLSG